ncbi:protein-L-isoaspartate(D-aspartate) O-methyltransferase [Vibrio sp.]|nr:protein-L-isoaspartate(D-aspartate) O-methyltransferase [Vibrio sp.]
MSINNAQGVKLAQYLKLNGIQDQQVLEVIQDTPRHLFVSSLMQHQAYDNNALPIGHGQTISQPYTVAKMTELLGLNQHSTVLEIGTGSGYQTAILAQLTHHVYSVERIKALQWEAKRRLKKLDLYNVSTKHADGWQGWLSKAPFDAIIVTAAAEELPIALLEQLSMGGTLVVPVGRDTQTLLKITRDNNGFHQSVVEKVNFVPLVAGELA